MSKFIESVLFENQRAILINVDLISTVVVRSDIAEVSIDGETFALHESYESIVAKIKQSQQRSVPIQPEMSCANSGVQVY